MEMNIAKVKNRLVIALLLKWRLNYIGWCCLYSVVTTLMVLLRMQGSRRLDTGVEI